MEREQAVEMIRRYGRAIEQGDRPTAAVYGLELVEALTTDTRAGNGSTPMTWPRLEDPPPHVTKVRTTGGTVFTRMDAEGRYWATRGWSDGVHWSTVLGWGPVEEVQDDPR